MRARAQTQRREFQFTRAPTSTRIRTHTHTTYPEPTATTRERGLDPGGRDRWGTQTRGPNPQAQAPNAQCAQAWSGQCRCRSRNPVWHETQVISSNAPCYNLPLRCPLSGATKSAKCAAPTQRALPPALWRQIKNKTQQHANVGLGSPSRFTPHCSRGVPVQRVSLGVPRACSSFHVADIVPTGQPHTHRSTSWTACIHTKQRNNYEHSCASLHQKLHQN